WALGVDLPNRVTASGGRYQFKDDWQFYDTLVTSFEYDDKLISWEDKSCNGMKLYNRDRGSVIVGTTGSVMVDSGGYEVYDLKGKKTGDFQEGKAAAASSDLTGADDMTDLHFANFIAAIRTGEKLTQPVESGNISVTMLQLSNIAWEVQRELKLDPKNGHILNDPEAMKFWGREYEKGWAPHL
ncbi:MAG: gfo/Idh/MocA family oxidoreductase, partial [Acidobacteriota bacterium]|nr:gfo/Idh/MocA family oxidoreductase [Acidobacteriota bacterium]